MERGAAHDITGIEQPTAQSGDSRTQDSAPARDSRTASPSPGLEFPRVFTLPGVDPFDEVEWEQRSAVIGNETRRGGVRAARRRDSDASGRSRRPTSSSRSISAGQIGTPERERSVKQLIGRVVDTITEWARKDRLLRERRAICRRSATS